jgi:UDP-glucose 4-epimerase
MKVLVTGGAGYIGSTVCSACLDSGIEPVILDNLINGRREFTCGRVFYQGDIADSGLIDRIFGDHPDICAAIHCAALIVVPDSARQPLRYYQMNVSKTIDLVAHLVRNGCERLIFSSSAAIYAPDEKFTVDEASPLAPASPYARTKAVAEWVLRDCTEAYNLRVVSLRYFNPIGADPKMRTGLASPNPSHVLGKLAQAHESRTTFAITGVDWPTRDGTGIRDYLHVWDLARAHVASVERFDRIAPAAGPRYEVINLGTGDGTTVRELVTAFEAVVGERMATIETAPRPGDSAGTYSTSRKAADLLGWVPQLSIEDGIRDALEWSRIRRAVLADERVSAPG